MELKEYAGKISLYEAFIRPEVYGSPVDFTAELDRSLEFLCREQREKGQSLEIPSNLGEKRQLLRALLNIRTATSLPDIENERLDRILWSWCKEEGVTDALKIGTLWRGDITRLNADAIVNAANSDMEGCFHPLHACIDNAIHTAAGPRLRQDCHDFMQMQGEQERTGAAKITRAYNLPSKYVLHTVGPIVNGPLTEKHKELLASCYSSCLDLAAQLEEIRTLAFCCISTGVFGYPKEEAARTAISAVRRWNERHPGRFDRIIFNVFTEEDHEIYQGYF